MGSSTSSEEAKKRRLVEAAVLRQRRESFERHHMKSICAFNDFFDRFSPMLYFGSTSEEEEVKEEVKEAVKEEKEVKEAVKEAEAALKEMKEVATILLQTTESFERHHMMSMRPFLDFKERSSHMLCCGSYSDEKKKKKEEEKKMKEAEAALKEMKEVATILLPDCDSSSEEKEKKKKKKKEEKEEKKKKMKKMMNEVLTDLQLRTESFERMWHMRSICPFHDFIDGSFQMTDCDSYSKEEEVDAAVRAMNELKKMKEVATDLRLRTESFERHHMMSMWPFLDFNEGPFHMTDCGRFSEEEEEKNEEKKMKEAEAALQAMKEVTTDLLMRTENFESMRRHSSKDKIVNFKENMTGCDSSSEDKEAAAAAQEAAEVAVKAMARLEEVEQVVTVPQLSHPILRRHQMMSDVHLWFNIGEPFDMTDCDCYSAAKEVVEAAVKAMAELKEAAEAAALAKEAAEATVKEAAEAAALVKEAAEAAVKAMAELKEAAKKKMKKMMNEDLTDPLKETK